ncbi:hypothetical protein XFF6970_290031 [Xanthomonas citri pv. fuscans]|nr:hypothetical protein XFF6970_290031 [Xanthomonas citri pv. fuscans]
MLADGYAAVAQGGAHFAGRQRERPGPLLALDSNHLRAHVSQRANSAQRHPLVGVCRPGRC